MRGSAIRTALILAGCLAVAGCRSTAESPGAVQDGPDPRVLPEALGGTVIAILGEGTCLVDVGSDHGVREGDQFAVLRDGVAFCRLMAVVVRRQETEGRTVLGNCGRLPRVGDRVERVGRIGVVALADSARGERGHW